MANIIEVKNLTKKFGDFVAVNNVSFAVLAIVSLIFLWAGSYFFSRIEI